MIANEINFHKQKTGRWGLRSNCKECGRNNGRTYYKNNEEKFKKYRKEHKEQHKDYMHQYYENNKEQILEYQKEYYEDNKEFYKEYKKEWYENNKDRLLKERKEYYKNNKEKIIEYQKQYNQENPEKIINRNNKRRLKEENQGDGITKEQWFEMMDFFNWECAYSGEYLGKNSKKRTIDHIIPLDKGGFNEIWNCVPMIKNYNSSKHTYDMLEWYQEQIFYSEERLNKIYEWQKYAFEKWGDDNGEKE